MYLFYKIVRTISVSESAASSTKDIFSKIPTLVKILLLKNKKIEKQIMRFAIEETWISITVSSTMGPKLKIFVDSNNDQGTWRLWENTYFRCFSFRWKTN